MTDYDAQELGALSQDLKRVANFIGLGSPKSAERFLSEAVKGAEKIEQSELPAYTLYYIRRIPQLPKVSDRIQLAEEALMIGCILQNAAVAAKH
ncbi:MAG: hypothetical protein AAB669_01955 [Patescibacteria group bacterium]